MDDIDSLCAGVYYSIHDIARHDFQVRGGPMENWYKPCPVVITRVSPDPRPKKAKPNWRDYSDIMDYQAKLIEKVRRRIERTKHR